MHRNDGILNFQPVESMSWHISCSSDDEQYENPCPNVKSERIDGDTAARSSTVSKPQMPGKPERCRLMKAGITKAEPRFAKRIHGMIATVRPRNKVFDELGFDLVRRLKKYLAVCRVCRKELQNTAARRLRGHRNVCANNNETPSYETADPSHLEPLTSLKTLEDSSSMPCEMQPEADNRNEATSASTPTIANSAEASIHELQLKIEQRRLDAIEQEIAFSRKTHETKMQHLIEECQQKRELHAAQLKAEEARRLYYENKLAGNSNS